MEATRDNFFRETQKFGAQFFFSLKKSSTKKKKLRPEFHSSARIRSNFFQSWVFKVRLLFRGKEKTEKIETCKSWTAGLKGLKSDV